MWRDARWLKSRYTTWGGAVMWADKLWEVLVTATPLGCLDMFRSLATARQSNRMDWWFLFHLTNRTGLFVFVARSGFADGKLKLPRSPCGKKRQFYLNPYCCMSTFCVLLCHSISERHEDRDTHLAVAHTDLSIKWRSWGIVMMISLISINS